MHRSMNHPLGITARLLIMAMLIVPLTLGTGSLARANGSPAPVDLGAAAPFAILTKTGVTNVPTSAVTGNIGASPIDSTAITGFSLILDSTTRFSTSAQVTGKIYAADYSAPTPANLTTAISNMETAYSDAAGRAPDFTELYAGDLSGQTLDPGVYKWSTGVLINADVMLAGSATDVWIFEIAQDLTVATNTDVLLSGGADARNIFWQVGGGTGVEIGAGAHVEGTILAAKAIHLRTGATLNGRALSQTAVTLDGNTVVLADAGPVEGTDFNCNDIAEVGIYRPSTGGWSVQNQFYDVIYGGVAGDVPVPADYDGNGCTDIAIFRDGVWYVKDLFTVAWGQAGDIPVPGDYNNDGAADLAIFRDGMWYIKDGGTFSYGAPDDIPVPGDYDGNGTTDVAVYRLGVWYVKDQAVFSYGGAAEDIPVPSDYDGNATSDIAVFRDGMWYIKDQASFGYGAAGDIPVPADYNGDSMADPAVFRDGMWYVKDLFSVLFGTTGDYPLPAPDTNGDADPYQ